MRLFNTVKGPSGLTTQVLNFFESGRCGLATDLDGTLSRLTARPDEALISEEGREALDRLVKSGRFEVIAVVSERSALASRLLVGLPELMYIGHQGLESL